MFIFLRSAPCTGFLSLLNRTKKTWHRRSLVELSGRRLDASQAMVPFKRTETLWTHQIGFFINTHKKREVQTVSNPAFIAIQIQIINHRDFECVSLWNEFQKSNLILECGGWIRYFVLNKVLLTKTNIHKLDDK